ncbi:MAG TPA: hypothetical protein PLT66_02180, partial [Bacillota bacterium]|nr:hypothetical protein [Bacillota bacterium]
SAIASSFFAFKTQCRSNRTTTAALWKKEGDLGFTLLRCTKTHRVFFIDVQSSVFCFFCTR